MMILSNELIRNATFQNQGLFTEHDKPEIQTRCTESHHTTGASYYQR